jgi:hypothetical protein
VNEFIEEQADVASEETLPDAHPGVEDGFVDAVGDRIVHEHDEEGNLTGWHKEPAEPNPDNAGVEV